MTPAPSRPPSRLLARIARGFADYALAIGVFLILVVFLLYPIYLTVRGGLAADPATGTGFTLRHVRAVFDDPTLLEGLFNSLRIASMTTVAATLIALPLSILAANFRFPLKGLFQAAVLAPMIIPPFVGAIGVRALLGREGAVNALFGTSFDVLGTGKLAGVVMLQALSLYPIIFLNATASLANLDPALDEAAENLGARPWTRFRRITLPLVRPGLFAGATIVFIWSFTELGTPLMFDYYRVTSVQVFNGLKEVENSAEPYALTIVMLSTALILYGLGRGVLKGRTYAMQTRAARAGSETVLTGARGWLATGLFAAVACAALMPHLGVILTSLTVPGQWYQSVLPKAFTTGHYAQALGGADAFQSIVNSLRLSVAAMMFDIGLGLLIGYLIVRTKVIGRSVIDALCMLPLAVPGLVMAFGFAAMSLRWPFKGGPLESVASIFGPSPQPFLFLIVAYSIRRLPYIVRSTVAGLEQTSGDLEEAAVNLGASRFTAVRRVIVPLIAANLIAGGLLVFSFSMLEVSDSLILAQQGKHFPATKQIFAFTERLGDGPYIASAMGVWGMSLLMVTLLGASLLLGKKLGSVFRV
jgi:iron(III) transport system permease protein